MNTSAYTHYQQKENIKSHREKLLNFFKENPTQRFTSEDLDIILNLKNSHKRVAELHREGLIYVTDKVKVKSEKKAFNFYQLTPENMIELVKIEIFNDDFRAWVKQGEKFKHLCKIQVID
jgi:hypothetical protein